MNKFFPSEMKSHKLFGVRIDEINQAQALELVDNWLKTNKQHYIVTPNVEIIIDAQKDEQFKEVLNKADLAIPDSSHLGWALKIPNFPIVTGVDLMEKLCELAAKKGWKVGFLGGRGDVAKKTAESLKKKYPGLKVTFAESGGEVNKDGFMNEDLRFKNMKNKFINHKSEILNHMPIDILFVAFGHIKQEKWIYKNLAKTKVKVMMAVGGSFDYLSGTIPRSPKFLRTLGLEWLFRVLIQPWRIKRFGKLVKFVLLVFAKT